MELYDGAEWHYASLHNPGEEPKPAAEQEWNFLPWWAGDLPPQDKWVELRVPLAALGMHDRPIRGVAFRQEGPGSVVWDRTALVLPGGEKVILEDGLPAGETVGQWKWVAETKRSGDAAHTGPAVNEAGGAVTHGVLLTTPVWEHTAVLKPEQPVLLQQIFLDAAGTPETVAIYLHDGRDWNERLVWGNQTEGAVYLGPLPQPGRWHELRIPLASTALRDEPIAGIAFEQTGGRAFWGRTSVIAGGKSHVIIDDTLKGLTSSTASAARWQWVAQEGQRAHTLAPGAPGNVHLVRDLVTPVTQHLSCDRDKALAALEKHIPTLGPTEEAWQFFELMRRLEGGTPQKKVARCDWFLKAIPGHPRKADVSRARDNLPADAGEVDQKETVPDLLNTWPLRKSVPSAPTAQLGTFLRNWQIIGGFHNHPKSWMSVCQPEVEPFNLNATYAAYDPQKGPVGWRLYQSPTDFVDVRFTSRHYRHQAAVAVCWAYAPHARVVRLDIGGKEGIHVRINRHLVYAAYLKDRAVPRDDTVYVTLPGGWSEIMLKIGQRVEDYGFYFEVRDPATGGRPSDVEFFTQPPTDAPAPKR